MNQHTENQHTESKLLCKARFQVGKVNDLQGKLHRLQVEVDAAVVRLHRDISELLAEEPSAYDEEGWVRHWAHALSVRS